MQNLNSVVLVGRLTKDIDVAYLQSGSAIGKFSLAVNRSVKKNGQWTEEANFFEITVFGKTVENLKQYLVKGSKVALHGYLKQDRWQKDGQNYSKVTVIADNIELCGGSREQREEHGGNVIAPNRNEDFAEDIPWESQQDDIPF